MAAGLTTRRSPNLQDHGARFVFVIGLALDVGLPMVRALKLAQSVIGNEAIRYRLAQATRDVTEGVGVGQAMAYQEVLPRMVTSMMEVGTETGDLSELMLAWPPH